MTTNSTSDHHNTTHIHLDTVGGIAGDMFVAACLDTWPSLETACQQSIAAMQPPASISTKMIRHDDGILVGSRFIVEGCDEPTGHAGKHHTHDHTHWQDIRSRLENAALDPSTRQIAISIFQLLAQAEATVHGIDTDAVAFHEVGAWDSIIDIVAAATLIAELGTITWSVGLLPRGRGLVSSDHGMLPVPAPATLELLHGFDMFDDGENGERITPTGAAILKHLEPSQTADFAPRKLLASGLGFGTKKLERRSNILRVTAFGKTENSAKIETDRIEVLHCEIDDQTPEDLAIGLDHLRGDSEVLDVCHWPVHAKKGRLASAVQVLAKPGSADRIAALIFEETTTLGVRHQTTDRRLLTRKSHLTPDGAAVKVAHRPGGRTAKAESDDLREIKSVRERTAARRQAEQVALKSDGKPSNGAKDDGN